MQVTMKEFDKKMIAFTDQKIDIQERLDKICGLITDASYMARQLYEAIEKQTKDNEQLEDFLAPWSAWLTYVSQHCDELEGDNVKACLDTKMWEKPRYGSPKEVRTLDQAWQLWQQETDYNV